MSPCGLNYRSAVWKYKNPNLCINLALFHVRHSSVEFSANGSTSFRLFFYSKDDGVSRGTVQEQSLKHLSGMRGEDTLTESTFRFSSAQKLCFLQHFQAKRRHDILSFSTLSDFTPPKLQSQFFPKANAKYQFFSFFRSWNTSQTSTGHDSVFNHLFLGNCEHTHFYDK